MTGGLVLAAFGALALFWLLVKPFALEAGTLGLNYADISARIGTAGMPTRRQFASIASAGYRVVVNLAPSSAMGSHADEAALVSACGMAYDHLPVDFAAPTTANYARFVALMSKHGDRRVLVHCQLNMRASVFVYPYRVLKLGRDTDHACEAVQRVWQPSRQWRELIGELHSTRGLPLPFAFESPS
jgi:protein tyrosine phosphatase (PTP) superfamily phosphohydrolase (DUF442 family)